MLFRTDTEVNKEKSTKNEELIKNILNMIENCNQKPLTLKELYIPSIRLTSDIRPKVIKDPEGKIKSEDVEFNLYCNKSKNEKGEFFVDYTKSYWTLNIKSDPNRKGLFFHTFSDKVSTTSVSYDVVTFYISFILVIGQILRSVISGEAEKIVLTEMPEPANLINLCEGVKISRYRYDFERYN
jgi:hypothetical protein